MDGWNIVSCPNEISAANSTTCSPIVECDADYVHGCTRSRPTRSPVPSPFERKSEKNGRENEREIVIVRHNLNLLIQLPLTCCVKGTNPSVGLSILWPSFIQSRHCYLWLLFRRPQWSLDFTLSDSKQLAYSFVAIIVTSFVMNP